MAANDVIASVTYTYAGTGSTVYGPLTNAPTLPGTYSITPSAVAFAVNGGATSNYTTITYTAGSLTINAASLVVTAASPASIEYGGTKAADTFTVTGLNATDRIGSITYSYAGTGSTVYGPTPTAPTAAGTYSITPSAATFSSGSAANYTTITYTAGSFTITKKALTVTPTAAQSFAYGTASPTYAFTVTGFIGSETTSNATGYVAPTCSASGYSTTLAVGSPAFTISCSGGSAANYSFVTTATTTATITQAPLTVSAEGKSVNYGSLAPTYTFGITGWRNSETAANATDYVAPTCSSSYTRTSPAGTPVAITCSGASAKNYSFSYSSANITIAKLGTRYYGSISFCHYLWCSNSYQ
jgi:hypothetical protein